MFTSEPSLAQRIERMIGDIPVVDAYALVSMKRPTVASLAELLADSEVQLELRGVGMPQVVHETATWNESTLASTIPYLKRMRNTATAWCLYRLLRDLYDFLDPDLQASNLNELEHKIAEVSAQPDWPTNLMAERVKLDSIMTVSIEPDAVDDDRKCESIIRILDATKLLSPRRTADANEIAASMEYDEFLANMLGDRPRDLQSLRKLVFDWLDRSSTPSIQACHLSVPTDFLFSNLDQTDGSAIFSQSGRGRSSTASQQNDLASLVGTQVLAWTHEQNRALHIRLSDEASSFEPRWSDQWLKLLPEYQNARIGFMVQSPASAKNAMRLAREFPNAFLVTSSSSLHVPAMIESELAVMIQSVPMTKIIAFASGASSIEWVYGRLQLAKKAMAGALARLVDRRYYEEDEIPRILEQVLHDTPKEFYGTAAGSEVSAPPSGKFDNPKH